MATPHHEDVVVTNESGEAFHVSVFPPSPAPAPADGDPLGPPVLLCVHGAGMSGDNFYRLAEYLQRGGVGASPPCGPAGSTVSHSPPPAPVPLTPSAPVGGRPPVLPRGLVADAAVMPPPPLTDALHEDGGMAMAVVTYDMRCHGTSTRAGGEDSLTLDVLVEDFLIILRHTREVLYPSSGIYVLGHSLGGAVVAAGLHRSGAQARVAGVVLVDVVEGTARMSLAYMRGFLEKRPLSFRAVREAEEWFLRHGGMRTPAGAAVSVPPLLKPDPATGAFVWRADLAKMEAVWDHWFDGLDKAFVTLPFPKMLCLANAERLDTELTVAQMQGKFQFEIIGDNCGHYIMDDAVTTLGLKLMRFVKRIETLTRKLKVGVKPGMSLHLNNTTIPPSRLDR